MIDLLIEASPRFGPLVASIMLEKISVVHGCFDIPAWGKARNRCEGFHFRKTPATLNTKTNDVYDSCKESGNTLYDSDTTHEHR